MNNNTIARFKLDPSTKGLAVNTRKNTYRLLTADELTECSMPHTRACSGKSYEYKLHQNRNCIFSYFIKDDEEVAKHCTIVPHEQPPPYQIQEIAPNNFLIFSQTERRLTGNCDEGISYSQADITLKKGNSYLMVQQGCILEDKNVLIYGTIQLSSTLEIQADITRQIYPYWILQLILAYQKFICRTIRN